MLNLAKFLFLLFVCAMSIHVSSEKFECKFQASSQDPEDLNYCYARKRTFNGTRMTIDSIEVIDLGNNTIDDIQALIIGGISSLKYIPIGIEKFFKNLQLLDFSKCDLQEITQNDIKNFPQLKYLLLGYNNITSIDANVFEYNPELKTIILQHNQISQIDSTAFDHLNKLEYLDLTGNNCTINISFANERSAVLEVIEQVKKGDCDMNTVKNETNEDCSTKYENLQQNFTSVINEMQDKYTKLEEKLAKAEKTINKQAKNFEKLFNEMNSKIQSSLDKILTEKLTEMSGKIENFINSKFEGINEMFESISDKLYEMS